MKTAHLSNLHLENAKIEDDFFFAIRAKIRESLMQAADEDFKAVKIQVVVAVSTKEDLLIIA